LVASTTRKKNIFGFSLLFWGRKRENSALTEEPSPAGQKNILKERKILSVFLWLFFAALNIYICGFLLHLKISTGLWNCLLSSVIVFTTLRHQTLQLMQLRHEKFIFYSVFVLRCLGSEIFMDFQFTPRSNDLSLSAIFASLPRPRFGLLIFPIHGFFLYFTSYVLHFSFFFAVLVQTYETRFVFVLHFCFVISIFSLFLAVIINSFAIRGPRRDG
jgi:hypothetical protein